MRIVLTTLSAAVVLAAPVAAQTVQEISADRIGIDVLHTGDDATGMMLASALRDALAESPRYGFDTTSPMAIELVTLDDSFNESESSAAVAVAYTFYHADGTRTLQNLQVLHVGRDRTKSMAQSLLANLDALLTEWSRY